MSNLSKPRLPTLPRLAPLAALVSLTLLAGCGGGAGDRAGAIGQTFISGGGTTAPDVDPTVFAVQETCPPIEVRADTYLIAAFARGLQGDPKGLQYQGSIRKYARECTRTGSMMTIKVGVSGRVVAGPAPLTGPVVLPLRIAVTGQEDAVLASQLEPVEVGLAEAGGSVGWSRVIEDIQVPLTGARKIYVGFDFDEKPSRR